MYSWVSNVRGSETVEDETRKTILLKNLFVLGVAVPLEVSRRAGQLDSSCSLLLRTAGYGLRTGSEERHGLLGDWRTWERPPSVQGSGFEIRESG